MHKEYDFSSAFAPYIKDYISLKRSAGFMFDNPSYWLFRFDQYCFKNEIADVVLTKGLFEDWAKKSSTETKTTQNNRLMALRGFSKYLNSLGINSYIPHSLPRPQKNIPYLMCDDDISAFFKAVDRNATIQRKEHAFQRMAIEYKVLFRVIFCCGLRNNEACTLKNEDVNLEEGYLTIIHSKRNKDRIVYLSDDLKALCREYREWMSSIEKIESPWFFPSLNTEKNIVKTSVDKKFSQFWNSCEMAQKADKKPTVHCLRHAFVIKRMNSWMKEGLDLNVMMPYLSKYLGHSGPSETYYYYHQTTDAFRIIRLKDKTAPSVIEEVFEDESEL